MFALFQTDLLRVTTNICLDGINECEAFFRFSVEVLTARSVSRVRQKVKISGKTCRRKGKTEKKTRGFGNVNPTEPRIRLDKEKESLAFERVRFLG